MGERVGWVSSASRALNLDLGRKRSKESEKPQPPSGARLFLQVGVASQPAASSNFLSLALQYMQDIE